MGLLAWLKRIFGKKKEKSAIYERFEIKSKPSIDYYSSRYTRGILIVEKRKAVKSIRGLKPRTVHERRLWKPDAKPDED